MAVSLQNPADIANDYAATAFIIRQFLNRVATAMLVTVKACTNNGGVSAYGFVDVIPLVNQVTGDGVNVPHGTIYRLPYLRIQGGTNAIILDPQPGDIGLAVLCMRDSSAVKADPVAAVANANANTGTPPGSQRQFDMADGLYIGGFLNGTPAQYVEFSAAGITVHSPTKVLVTAPEIDLAASTKVVVTAPEIDLTAATVVNVQAPTINLKGEVVQTAGNVSMAENLTVTGDVAVGGTTDGTGAASFTGGVTGAGVVLQTHEHPPGTYTAGATSVTGVSGPP